jgi:hypothetical protein
LARDLVDAGEPVVRLDDLSAGFRWALPPGDAFSRGTVGIEDSFPRSSTRLSSKLESTPRFDNIDTIAAHALSREHKFRKSGKSKSRRPTGNLHGTKR